MQKYLMQKLIMSTISEHDLSKQECAHIINGMDIVEFSRKFETVNIGRTRRLDVNAEGRRIRVSNLADNYWERETNQKYLKKCEEFRTGKIDWNPKDVSLYDFIANFNKKWENKKYDKVPHIIPNFSTIPKKTDSDRYVMLQRIFLI